MKWAMELNEFDIVYKPGDSIIRQAFAEFIEEFVNASDIEVAMELIESPI